MQLGSAGILVVSQQGMLAFSADREPLPPRRRAAGPDSNPLTRERIPPKRFGGRVSLVGFRTRQGRCVSPRESGASGGRKAGSARASAPSHAAGQITTSVEISQCPGALGFQADASTIPVVSVAVVVRGRGTSETPRGQRPR